MAAGRPRPPYPLIGVFLCLAIGVLAGVYRYGLRQNRAIESEVRDHLLSLADLKVERLTSWRQRLLGEMQGILATPGVEEAFARQMEAPGDAAGRARLEAWFGELRRGLRLHNLLLVDLHGRIVASSGEAFGNAGHLAQRAAEASSWQDPFLSDFHIDEGGGAVHFGLNAPLRRTAGGPVFGALLAGIDPASEIYPILQISPGLGASEETLLVRREGEEVVFLNPLRFSSDPALNLRMSLTSGKLVAAEAVHGGQGALDGVDYRGTPVLAAARPVPGSNWSLIVKIDRREALAPSLQGWLYLGSFAVGLILASGAGVFWLWRRQQWRFFHARAEAEETLRTVLESSPAAIISLDAQGRVVLWNKAAEDLFGWTAAEIAGQPLPCIPPEARGRHAEFEGLLRSGGVVRGVAVEAVRKDGSRFGMSLSRALLRDAQGAVTGDMAVLYDITAQKRAEEALQASESLLRAAFHQAAVGMAHVRLDGHFLRVNRRYCEITGYSEGELLERSYLDITYPEDVSKGEEEVQRLIAGEIEEHTGEKRYLRPDGQVVWICRTVSVIRARSEQPLHLLCVVQDITSRVKAREDLARSEARLRQVVENAPEGIAIVQDLTYRYVNPALARLLEGEAGTLVGRTVLERLQPEDRGVVESARERFLQGEAMAPTELRTTSLRGRPLTVEVSSAPMDYEGQRAALVFFRDVSARRREEEERGRLEAQLQQSQKMESIGRLAGGVAHDFNNLLTIINGYSDMLLGENGLTEPIREGMEEIRAAGVRASDLTQQLLAFSRKQIAEPRVLNLNGVIRESERMLRRLIGEDIEIVSDLAEELDCVMADRGQMHQVLMNLVVNARDAMPRGGRVSIQTRNAMADPKAGCMHPEAAPGPYVALAVSDTGIGMSPETVRQIFEPFFTTKQRTAGTGLGLSTVYGIVKHAGGWIEVTSRVDHGSTFRVCLPRTQAACEPASRPVEAGAAASEAPAETTAGTVMVVEDQAQVRRMVLAILRQNGYRLLEAADGTEALSLCERHEGALDLLITDVVMPGMNGVELSDRMRRLRPTLRTLFISGYTADVLGPSGALAPGMSHLAKPFSPAQLSRKIREVLGARITARLLVIDDDAGVRSLLDRLLTDSGYEVRLAADGNDGLRLASEHPVDVVITDLVMPEREGLETIPALRKLHPEAWIVAISGAFGGQYLKAARMLGADRTLPKPVDREELLAVLRELVAHPRVPAGPVEAER